MKTIAINTAASFPGGLSAWQDGDVHRESNCDQIAQDVADGLGWLKGNAVALTEENDWAAAQNFEDGINVTGDVNISGGFTGAGFFLDTPRTVTKLIKPNRADGTWTVSAAGVYTASGVGGTSNIVMASVIGIPPGVTITDFEVTIDPAGGHSNLPATMPVVRLRRYTFDASFTDVASATDSSANTTVYQGVHAISVTGLSHTYDETLAYELQVVNEGAADSVAGLAVLSFSITYTESEL